MTLRLDPPEGFPVDEIYAALVALGAERDDRDSRRAMAALALVLINHIADEDVVREAIALVRALPPAGQSKREDNDA